MNTLAVKDETGFLKVVSGIDAAIQRANSIHELKDLESRIRGVEAFVRAEKMHLEQINRIGELRLRCRRRIGGMLPDDGPGRPPAGKSNNVVELHPQECVRLREESRVSEDDFRGYVQTCNDEGMEVTAAGLRSVAKRGLEVHFSSASSEWNTPKHIVNAVVEVLGEIDLDPCCNSGKANVPAKVCWREKDDGLSSPWRGRVYMNPPYGTVIADWCSMLVDAVQEGDVPEAVALLPSRTDTEWFQELEAASYCFIRGRLKFNDGDVPAPFPSVAVYWGKRTAQFAAVFSGLGQIMEVSQ